ncbi:chitin synthase-domain-containing protein [Dichotomocladium elegans]|nr:chitin synthase-domain-containing protein [Dichotomocladium elegans]
MRVAKDYSYMRRTPTWNRFVWVLFSRLCTFILPDSFLKFVVGLPTADSRQAWREKIASCFVFLTSVLFFIFWIEYISTLFCDTEDFVSYNDVFKNSSKYVGINGRAFEYPKYLESPLSSVAADVEQYSGKDASSMFPTFMMLDRQGRMTYADDRLNHCIVNSGRTSQADAWLAYKLSNDPGYMYKNGLKQCPYPNDTLTTGASCYPWPFPGLPLKGDIVYDTAIVSNYTTLPSATTPGKAYVILNGRVLDVTAYLDAATNVIEMSSGIYSRAFALDRMFLPLDVTVMLFINLGTDITDMFMTNITNAKIYNDCLDLLFFKGVVEEAAPTGCKSINPALWGTMGVGLLYFLVKMNLANLCRLRFMQRFLFSSTPELSSVVKMSLPHTIMMIPCYAEPSEVLRQTFESLARSNYDDAKKLLLFVCDGLSQSKMEIKETHLCILELLGYSGTVDPCPQRYISLGEGRKKDNCAKVYSGYYETGRNRVPYLVVVKTGGPREISEKDVGDRSSDLGNRGKRDSMVLVFSFLERCMNLAANRMTQLEYELFNQCYSVLGIDPRRFKYLLVVDADMQVQSDAVPKLVSRLEKDRRMLAVSGYVRPANPEQNITTMLQIFPLYQISYSGLAYEAFLGTVLSVNGGLVMYKLWTENTPLVPTEQPSQWYPFESINSIPSSQQAVRPQPKWPKTSDEIISAQSMWDETGEIPSPSMLSGQESRLSLSPNADIRPCCLHPTVLRGFATPKADTMHMKNVLLLGEEQYLSVVLLKSHPHHRLGFEPEAVGYVTLPTNLFALQGQQSRSIRVAFHNQLEMQRVAWDLGFGCWLVSVTKLFDMIFSVPVILYLYSIFIRLFMHFGLAYAIIALSFGCLVSLHIIYFIVRRQFKYVLWFIIYCLFSVPLFAIWYPFVAIWCSDYGDRWYDVWPTSTRRYRSRRHGIIDHYSEMQEEEERGGEENRSESKGEEMSDNTPRMRLGEYEAIEAEKSYQRAIEEAAALDSNFAGFTGFVGGGRNSVYSMHFRRSQSITEVTIPTPAPAQIRTGGMRLGVQSMMDPNGNGFLDRADSSSPTTASVRSNSFANPFSSALDDPFDDGYAIKQQNYFAEEALNRRRSRQRFHKPSHSQSSYLTHSSRTTTGEDYRTYYAPTYPVAATSSTSTAAAGGGGGGGFADGLTSRCGRSYSTESIVPMDRISINSAISNTFSMASSSLSLDPEVTLETGRYDPSASFGRIVEEEPNEEGRSAALHGKVGLMLPGHPRYSSAATTGPPASLPLRVRSSWSRRHQQQQQQQHHKASATAPHPPPPGSSTVVQQHRRDPSDEHREDAVRDAIVREIRAYLEEADLDLTTRAQVKGHLYDVFGATLEQDGALQEFIHQNIESITLEFLTRSPRQQLSSSSSPQQEEQQQQTTVSLNH